MRALAACLFFVASATLAAAHDGAGGLPPSFEAIDIPGTLVYPIELTFAPDGDMYVAEKGGQVFVYRNQVLQPTAVLDIRGEVSTNGDRGLMSVALHPGFVPDGGPTAWMYVFYTESPVYGQDLKYNENDEFSHGVLARYAVDVVGGEVVAPKATRQVILGERLPDGTAPDAFATVHNSHAQGTLLFGADGTLLVSHGDGAHHNFPDNGGFDLPAFDDFVHPVTGLRGQLPKVQDSGAFRSQDLRSLSGKVLRIDPDTGDGLPSNPFWDGDPNSNASRVWALGLRNPYRMTLLPGTGATDPGAGDPGTLLVGDVGYWRYEELNWVDGPALNFGWPCREGIETNAEYAGFFEPQPNPFGYPACDSPTVGVLTDAMVGYHHYDAWKSFPPGVYVDGQGQSLGGLLGACIIGGAVYPGGDYPPEYAGRYFFADYSGDYIKTLEFDAAGNPIAIRDFADGPDRLADLEVHPLTGDVYYVDMGVNYGTGHVVRIRYGENLSPTAVLAVDAPSGTSPHAVTFDGSGSSDPEGQPLLYSWDFGDGTPGVQTTVATVDHTYTQGGVFHPVLRVTDTLGLFDETTTSVAVDSVPPLIAITGPVTGSVIGDGVTEVLVTGSGLDPAGGELDYAWQVNLHHNVHVHPAIWSDASSGGTATSTAMPIDPHGDGNELVFYEVLLTASKADGATATDTAWYFPANELIDPVGTAQLVSALDDLLPPESLGTGNPDIEVIRDGISGTALSGDDAHFDTFHDGDQGDDDWIGLVLPSRPEPNARFVSLTFTEGPHDGDGGWFEDFAVEVLAGGVWSPVDGLVLTTPFAGGPGAEYETFRFRFTPQYGEGIRLRGKPGGAKGYVTCSELGAGMITTAAWQTEYEDLSDLGELELLVDYLTPPGSQGLGNPDPELLRNGTLPAAGSTSSWAQYATFHGGDQAGEDWLGYRFAEPRTIQSLLFQEGLHFPGGGWFDTVRVETRLEHDGAWAPVQLQFVDPPFRSGGQGGQSYETFTFHFEPVVARDVRLIGVPGGADSFVTAAELRVRGPWWNPGACGTEAYGNTLLFGVAMTIASTTPPIPGHPLLVEVTDADKPEAAPGAMLIGTAETFLDFGDGVLLVDPVGAIFSPIVFDVDGRCDWLATLPDVPAFAGLSLYLQAGRFTPTHPGGVRYSQGLAVEVCQ